MAINKNNIKKALAYLNGPRSSGVNEELAQLLAQCGGTANAAEQAKLKMQIGKIIVEDAFSSMYGNFGGDMTDSKDALRDGLTGDDSYHPLPRLPD